MLMSIPIHFPFSVLSGGVQGQSGGILDRSYIAYGSMTTASGFSVARDALNGRRLNRIGIELFYAQLYYTSLIPLGERRRWRTGRAASFSTPAEYVPIETDQTRPREKRKGGTSILRFYNLY